MSNLTTGQIIGSVIGAAIGGYWGFAAAMIGMSLGGTIGLWLDPPSAPDSPPLGDIGINTFVRNAPVPIAYGQTKVYGGVIWIGDVSTSTTGSGKTNMDVIYAVAHCEGQVLDFVKYYANEKEIAEAEEENMMFSFGSYYGTVDQGIDNAILVYQGVSGAAAACPFKWTCYSIVSAHFGDGMFSALPTISVEVKAHLTLEGEEDANPIECAYDFLTESRYAVGYDPTNLINGDLVTEGSPWKIAKDICNELVSYIDENGTTINEPRYRYSNFIVDRTKGFDILADMMLSCRGMLRLNDGKWEPVIHTGNEEVTFYYSDHRQHDFVLGSGNTVNRLYSDFSAYPDDYLNGAFGVVDDESFVIFDQTSTYIDLVFDLSAIPSSSTSIKITKDNIKEGSFNYTRNGEAEVPSKVRVEFINRKMLVNDELVNTYQWDVYDYESPSWYDTEFSTKTERTIRIGGVKRKSHAMREAQFFADYAQRCRHCCEFVTDIVGLQQLVGDVIGISHTIANWTNKLFTVVGIEELENDEFKFTCVEYNADVLIASDIIPVVVNTSTTEVLESPFQVPDVVTNLNVKQGKNWKNNLGQPDTLTKDYHLYINFDMPEEAKYVKNIMIYVKKGPSSPWDYIGSTSRSAIYGTLSSEMLGSIPNGSPPPDYVYSEVALVENINGIFPESVFSGWVGDEYIENGVLTQSDGNASFTAMDRGYNYDEPLYGDVNFGSHAIGTTVYLKSSVSVPFSPSDVGSTWTFKAVTFNVSRVESDFDLSPTASITIS